ncbi:malto-oligosyltrehalose synthase [Mucilaginibacter sp.]
MFNPVSTYRIQFHQGFNFDDFERIIPYLEQLGVSTIYASPIFQSVPGSMHGYDGANPLQINTEIGTIEQLRLISKKLKKKNIGWIQDIVPNHMAFHPDNEWLMDTLKKGEESEYKIFFDQSLSSDLYKGQIMVPFLGETLDEAVNTSKVQIAKINDGLFLTYTDQKWPLNLAIDDSDLPEINQDKAKLLKIAREQYYRLCSWKETDTQINFRRFFTVNSLICLNIQNEEVFKKFHGLILALVREGVFEGLRIDHVDGLYDPTNYLKSLRKIAGDKTYIIVEKILGKNEQLPQWPIQGTTGYEFLAQVNNLLTNRNSEKEFNKFYNQLTGRHQSVKKQILDKKALILNHHMEGELDNLANLFIHLHKSTLDKEKLKQAIASLLIHCPVYRYYGNQFPLKGYEADKIRELFSDIKYDHQELSEMLNVLEQVILGSNKKYLQFYMRCMQFTGPLMAKGVEDTLMYTYERFSAHNEVGDAPGAFGISTHEFHELMQQRQQDWPFALNASATHDTKRGEDVRARLNVLPDLADEWFNSVAKWQKMNISLKQVGAPDANDEYLIYQTLVGAYPMPGELKNNFKERLLQYLEKTMREAKIHSDWGEPNANYENGVKQFAIKLLDEKRPFWKSFIAFQAKVAELGLVNSLAQVMLKF